MFTLKTKTHVSDSNPSTTSQFFSALPQKSKKTCHRFSQCIAFIHARFPAFQHRENQQSPNQPAAIPEPDHPPRFAGSVPQPTSSHSNEKHSVSRHRISIQSRTRSTAPSQRSHAVRVQPERSSPAVTDPHRRTDRWRTLHSPSPRTPRGLRQHRSCRCRIPDSAVPPGCPALVRSPP